MISHLHYFIGHPAILGSLAIFVMLAIGEGIALLKRRSRLRTVSPETAHHDPSEPSEPPPRRRPAPIYKRRPRPGRAAVPQSPLPHPRPTIRKAYQGRI